MKLALSLLTVIALATPAMAKPATGGGGGSHAAAASHSGGGGGGGGHAAAAPRASSNNYVERAPAPRVERAAPAAPHYIARQEAAPAPRANPRPAQENKAAAYKAPEAPAVKPSKQITGSTSKAQEVKAEPKAQQAKGEPSKSVQAKADTTKAGQTGKSGNGTVAQQHQPSTPIKQTASSKKQVPHDTAHSVVETGGKVRPATENTHNVATTGRLKDPNAVIKEGKNPPMDNTLGGKTTITKTAGKGANGSGGTLHASVTNKSGREIKQIDQNSKGTTFTNTRTGLQTHVSPKGNVITRTNPKTGEKTVVATNRKEVIQKDGTRNITYRGGTKMTVNAQGVRTSVTRVNGVRTVYGGNHNVIINNRNVSFHERNVFVNGNSYHYNYVGYGGRYGWGYNTWVPCYHPWIYGFAFGLYAASVYSPYNYPGYYVFNPWVSPWSYAYNWNYPWYGYWGSYFSPYTSYPSPGFYLANAYFDYSYSYLAARRAQRELDRIEREKEIAEEQALSAEDREDQADELAAAADLRAQQDELDSNDAVATQDSVMTDELRDQIRTEVEAAVIEAKKANVAPNSDVSTPAAADAATNANSVAIESVLLAHPKHAFEVNMGSDGDGDTITATTNHPDPNNQGSFLPCQLGMGDYIQLADPNQKFESDTNVVDMKVLKSNQGSCNRGEVVQVFVSDLQTMVNEFNASLAPIVEKMQTLPGVPQGASPTIAQQQ